MPSSEEQEEYRLLAILINGLKEETESRRFAIAHYLKDERLHRHFNAPAYNEQFDDHLNFIGKIFDYQYYGRGSPLPGCAYFDVFLPSPVTGIHCKFIVDVPTELVDKIKLEDNFFPRREYVASLRNHEFVKEVAVHHYIYLARLVKQGKDIYSDEKLLNLIGFWMYGPH